ncbi:hypothetical protein HIM_06153 [Hirsutella minnesotensis 3608]|uniref:DUF4419 domain-containing protein n=1 Tax=Hirsutella minnesotensis 3608 TaxID=1043627 RepID=A0A0F7ZZP0_9HYPO|nr:hypothetical protein HIM_06153 [Hirsutella minnesotensis 3608]
MTRAALFQVLALGLSTLANADIVVPVSDVKPIPLQTLGTASSALQLFEQSCPEQVQAAGAGPAANVIVSSYSDRPHDLAIANGTVYASSDSLVRGAIDAWAQHQDLVLRPDVVWFEILAQLNLYMTKHAEELRHMFVDFGGKQEIVVLDWTWQSVIDGFKSAIQQRVKTKWLEAWLTPDFSTTTDNDKTTASVLMMGLMQHYFSFTGGIICGLPSVRLLGEREDWVKLQKKLDSLKQFGVEPSQYAQNLRPILNMFVQTWDKPKSEEVRAFWKQIVRADKVFTCGAGPIEYDVSGWITGFMHWTASGELRVPEGVTGSKTTIGGVSYQSINLNQLPVGYARAPLKMLDFPTQGTNSMAYVVAGNIGIGRAQQTAANGRRTGVVSQPLSAWFLYGPVDPTAAKQDRDTGSRNEVTAIYRGLRTQCPRGGF